MTEPEHPGRNTVPDELRIVAQAQTDPIAFAPLYKHYFPIVLGYCQRRLGDREIAADATSQVFIRALNALPNFRSDPSRPGSTFRSWLFTIAHNIVVDTHRRDRKHRSLDAPGRGGTQPLAESPALIDPARSPEEHAVAADTRRQVRRMLARLPERQRQIVEFRLAGLTGAEIAEALGMSLSAVKSAQFRAYGTLRELLDHPTRPIDLAATETTDAPQ
ncbi:MAG: sigma-70 family RNA polymerase sigma factor [Thermomicrobiales bacterium]